MPDQRTRSIIHRCCFKGDTPDETSSVRSSRGPGGLGRLAANGFRQIQIVVLASRHAGLFGSNAGEIRAQAGPAWPTTRPGRSPHRVFQPRCHWLAPCDSDGFDLAKSIVASTTIAKKNFRRNPMTAPDATQNASLGRERQGVTIVLGSGSIRTQNAPGGQGRFAFMGVG